VTAPRRDCCQPLRFRSRDRRGLDAWAGGQAALAAYTTRIGEILEAAQAGDMTAVFDGGWRFTGLAAVPGQVLPGWRHDGGLMVPDPGPAAGRWVTAAIARAPHPGNPRRWLPGLPPAVVQPEALPGWHAELLERGTALYVGWPVDARDQSGGWPDPRLWKQARRAEAQPAAAGGELR
jgi:hypothetical protein